MANPPVHFESPDGTRIAAFRSGTGPPLVLVHGTTADHGRWNILLPRVETRFTCYALDRRGRGASGDHPNYSIEKEYEDVATVIDAIGGPVDVLGHSFGGLVALEAALRARHLRRLVLYEPAAFVPGSDVYGQEILERLEWMLQVGDRENLIVTMLRDVAGVQANLIELLRRQPYWANRVATAPTIPRELRADERYRLDPERLRGLRAPTLLILGGASPDFYRTSTVLLQKSLPDARTEEIPGHGHTAIDTATRQFADIVLRFLTS